MQHQQASPQGLTLGRTLFPSSPSSENLSFTASMAGANASSTDIWFLPPVSSEGIRGTTTGETSFSPGFNGG
ncbi:hypothetical protein CFP56_039978 [Quercus suber]|uniref:Uncharacterized protein n=1 Tax=Quercus suber TaxID=58331 RepID=A0AAW0IYD9_QUESU